MENASRRYFASELRSLMKRATPMFREGDREPLRKVQVHRECKADFLSLPRSYRSHLVGGLPIRPGGSEERLRSAFVDNHSAVLHTVKTKKIGRVHAGGVGGIGPLWMYVLLGMKKEDYLAMVAKGRDRESPVWVIAVAEAGIGPLSRDASVPKWAVMELAPWRKYMGAELARYYIGSGGPSSESSSTPS